MALNLRKSIARNGVMVGGFCLLASLALSVVTGGKLEASMASLGWPVLLALGIGGFTAWQVTSRIKQGILRSLPPAMSYLQLQRGQPVNGIDINWDEIDNYAIQLETRGYTRLGDFTPYPLQANFVGAAACFVDRDASTLIEIQQIHLKKALTPPGNEHAGGTHFAIMSVFGGNITSSTTDHVFKSSNFVIRGDYTAVATFPGLTLLELLEKHTRLRAHLREKTGKAPMPGLTMTRYLYLQRERFAQARRRLQARSGYQIAAEIDAFEAAPRTNWATSSSVLAALPIRPFEELESGEFAQGLPPPILTSDAAATLPAVAGGAASGAQDLAGVPVPDQAHPLREQINSSANWFYWVAGLSLVNVAVALAGSNWAFAIGLGLPQVFMALAANTAGGGALAPHVLVLWALSLAVPGFFLACGWFARYPSLTAFVAGTVVFAIDSLVFVLAADWIGIAFHALVLYFLWKGIAATRQYRHATGKQGSRQGTPANG